MDEARKANEAKTFLDRRLEAATRSDDPQIIRNTITALAGLKGAVRLGILVDLLVELIPRVAREAPGDRRYFALLAHSGEVLGSLDQESLTFVRERIAEVKDRNTAAALLTLLPADSSADGADASRPSPLRRWLAAYSIWPRFRFWYLAGVAAAAAALTMLAVSVVLLGLAYWNGGGANPWGWSEATVLLTIIAIAASSTALSGWAFAAGGTAMHGWATLALEALRWGLVGSVSATLVLWLAPDALPFIAWIRASAVGEASAQEQMTGFVLAAWPLLFAATAGTRWLGTWLVERRPDTSAMRLILVAGGLPAAAITLFVMFGLRSAGALRGEMIGIWLLVVAVAYSSAAVTIAIETVPSRMQALRTRRDKEKPLTWWAAGAALALLLSIIAQPLFFGERAQNSNEVVEIPRPGSRIIPVTPNVDLEITLKSSGTLLVKSGSRSFVINSPADRRIYLTPRGHSIVVCVLGPEDLRGGETSSACERPSLGWIADIFNAPTSFANRASVAVRQLPRRQFLNLGTLDGFRVAHTGRDTVEFTVSQTWTLVPYSPHQSDVRGGERTILILERERPDGVRNSIPLATLGRDMVRLEAGRYRLCARRFINTDALRLASAGMRESGTVPTSYEQLQALPCNSALLRPPAAGMSLTFAILPEVMPFHNAVTGPGSVTANGPDAVFRVERPSILLADFEHPDARDPVLYLVRASDAEEPIASADDPESMVAKLEPGDYRLCGRELLRQYRRREPRGVQESQRCQDAAGGTVSYRFLPLVELQGVGSR